ncbi:hypothetical protein [Ramlibacter algicola]|uniref:Uncharacterized protein n=1 Tax=Ramlibacter algicola TaxID=2795217 RepID=A0A934Q0I6_9BURK|nr:hypothetical protein [Ramlibacter algicola]MBK0392493.1 hypothetical protein [Ramlibacter algicola]
MNPEIRRYAWLDLGWHRLVIAPLVLATLAAIPLVAARSPSKALAWGAAGLFLAVTLGWGTMRALASVSEEARERTWDFQRMSASTAAELALGKVFGAPVFQWYVGAWCLAVFLIAGLQARLPNVAAFTVAMLGGAVLLHALGVALSAAGSHLQVGQRARRGGAVVVFIGLLQMAPMALMLLADRQRALVRWWGLLLSVETFAALSMVLFAGWAVLAAWRALSRELREPVQPWAWPAFAAFAALWWAGLSTPTHDRVTTGEALGLAAAILVLATYVSAVVDPLTPVSLARTLRAWRPGAARWQHRIPDWLLHGALAVIVGAAAFAFALPGQVLASALLVAACLALRDAAIVGCFGLLTPLRNPVGRAIFYIALADLLLPFVLVTFGLPEVARLVFPVLALPDPGPGTAAAIAAVQAALALGALVLAAKHVRRLEPAAA